MMTSNVKNWMQGLVFTSVLAAVVTVGFGVTGTAMGRDCGAKPQAADEAAGLAEVSVDKPETAQDWLALAEKKHAAIKTLTAKVDWVRIQGLLGDEQQRLGTLKIDLREPAKFVVYFNELKFGRRVKKQNKWYIFDGRWLVEKIIDMDKDKKQFFKWEIVPPNKKGNAAQANPLAVGQGPFAVPVPVNRQVINDRFEVELIPLKKDADASLVQLRLKPKAKFKEAVKFTSMDIWYDRQSLIPAKVRSIDDSENESIFQLKEAVADAEIEKNAFKTKEPPVGQGWEVQITPWGK